MSALFPAPVRAYTTFEDEAAPSATSEATNTQAQVAAAQAAVPRYPLRVQQRFVPRSLADFGDGGAYPELHVAQFPLNMGKKGGAGSSQQSSALALQVRGEDGKVSYDAVVTQHHRNKSKVYTKFSDIVEKDDVKGDALALPSKEDEAEATSRTRDALQALVQGQITAALPTNVARQKAATETSSYIRYTPNDQGKMGGESRQRIIRMVEVARDPMEPPKFQHKKAVRGPPSPPVPVLHSPPRKLTVQDQQAWKIPPVISNWKNSKGFTIALDKRLAADGRGLQQVTVNDNFASLSEALAIAERKAREEVNMRAQVQKKLAMKQKEQKENELRELASKARMERAGIRPEDDRDDDEDRRHRRRSMDSDDNRSDRERRGGGEYDGDEERERRERDRIRRDRKKEREREMRLENMGRKGKMARDDDRDVSEKIALGQLQGAGKLSGEAMFDSRLFNQSQGMSSGFGKEDEYNVYSKPLVDRGKASVYRPKGDAGAYADADKDFDDLKGGQAKRFKADKQFRGTEEIGRRGERDGPVQFSYDNVKDEDEEDDKRDDRRSPGRRPRSPSRSRDRRRSPSRSPIGSRGRSRQEEDKREMRDDRRRPRSPSRSRSRCRSPSRSPIGSRGRSDKREMRDDRRSPGRRPHSPSHSRSRRRSPSRSPIGSRGRSHRRSPSRSPEPRGRARRRSPSSSRSRSRGRSPERKRSRRNGSDDDSDDPFGLDQFLTNARKEGDKERRRR